MANTQDIIKKTANYIKTSVTLKIVSVSILILLLLIPTVMIKNLIRERQSRHDSVVKEISQKWGYSQTITGPFITIPFKIFYKDSDGATQFNLNHLHILPETLYIAGEIKGKMIASRSYETAPAKEPIIGNIEQFKVLQIFPFSKACIPEEQALLIKRE